MAEEHKPASLFQAISCNTVELTQALTHWRNTAHANRWPTAESDEGDARAADFLIRTIRAIQFHMPLPTE